VQHAYGGSHNCLNSEIITSFMQRVLAEKSLSLYLMFPSSCLVKSVPGFPGNNLPLIQNKERRPVPSPHLKPATQETLLFPSRQAENYVFDERPEPFVSVEIATALVRLSCSSQYASCKRIAFYVLAGTLHSLSHYSQKIP